MLTHEDRDEIFNTVGGAFQRHDGAVLEALSEVADQIIAQRLAYAALLARLDAAHLLDGREFVQSLQALAPRVSVGRGKALSDIASYCQARLGPPPAETPAFGPADDARAGRPAPPPSEGPDARLAALLHEAQESRAAPSEPVKGSKWDRGRTHRAQLHLRD
jgi:hypothetical protein